MGKNYTRKKTKYKNIIKNLKLEDKLIHLFKLFFDEQLIETICGNKIIISIENNNSVPNIVKPDQESREDDLNDEIKKVEKLYKYIKLEDSKSFLSEKIAENYYKLGMLNYSYFSKNEEEENFSTNFSTILKIINNQKIIN